MQTKKRGDAKMSSCNRCNGYSKCNVILDDGETICDNCDLELCPKCYRGEPTHEIENGDYICTDCYADMCDYYYEQEKDRLAEW